MKHLKVDGSAVDDNEDVLHQVFGNSSVDKLTSAPMPIQHLKSPRLDDFC